MIKFLNKIKVKPNGADDSQFESKDNIKMGFKITYSIEDHLYFADSYFLDEDEEVESDFSIASNFCPKDVKIKAVSEQSKGNTNATMENVLIAYMLDKALLTINKNYVADLC